MGRIYLLLAAVLLGASVHAGSLYVPSSQGATATHGRVTEFDATTGQFKRQTVALAADIVTAVTFGPDRRLYLSLWDPATNSNGRILVTTRQGTNRQLLIKPGTGGLGFPIGLRFGPDGYLYVASAHLANSPIADKVLKFNRYGKYIATVAAYFGTPQEILFAPDGSLMVSNGAGVVSSIYKLDPVRNIFVSAFVPTGTGGLKNPTGMAIGPDRNLYVVSFPRNAVLRFNGSTGDFVDVFSSLDGLGLDTPTDLVFGPDGNLYVLANSAIVRFDGTSGQFMDIFIDGASAGLGSLGETGMLFVDPGCSRYGDYGLANRCFTGAPQP